MTTKEIITFSMVTIGISGTITGIWIAIKLSVISSRLNKIFEQNENINIKVEDSHKLHSLLDKMLALVHSVKGNTTIENSATGGRTHGN